MRKYISSSLLFISALIWGLSFTTQKSASAIHPFTLGLMRGILAFLFLLALTPFSDKICYTPQGIEGKRRPFFSKNEIIGGIVAGCALSLATFLQQLGIFLGADAGRCAFITSLYVALVPVYSLFLRKKSPLTSYIGVGIAIVGFYLICINGEFRISTPDLSILGCALIFPIHILTIELFNDKCNAIRMSAVQFGVVALLNLPLSILVDSSFDINIVVPLIPEILFLGIMASGVAYTTQIIGQRGTNPTVASLILSLESVFGVIGGAIFFGERLTPRESVGCAVVLLSVLLCEIDFSAIFKKKSK